MRYFIITTFVGFIVAFCISSRSEVLSTEKTIYHSQEDELITIRKLAVLPLIDNVGGIYGRPLEKHLIEIITKDHHLDYSELSLVGPLVSPEELESNKQKVLQISSGSDADAIVSARLIKGPSGISMKLNLFSTKDHKLLAQSEQKNIKRFEVKELKEKLHSLFKSVIKKIPYDGIVLSRNNQRVTVNLGKNDGIEEGRVLSVVQIIKLHRHPKFNFLISSEKKFSEKLN